MTLLCASYSIYRQGYSMYPCMHQLIKAIQQKRVKLMEIGDFTYTDK